MKISYIGTYPPRECGIGTFTNNLIRAIIANTDPPEIALNASVVAMNDPNLEYDYPEEVEFKIRQEHQRDYVNAAKFINFNGGKVCILEHEFGIFGGESGVYILTLIHRLKIPLIVTFHTVLREPSFIQKSIVQGICKKADKVVVMSNRAIEYLHDIYNVPFGKLAMIEHGVPDYEVSSKKSMQRKFDFENRKVLFTFGLLSRNKGIETVINALPGIVEKYPEVLYIVLGTTHPSVIRANGDEYRSYLHRLVKKNNLEDHVYFNKSFVDERTLFEYLSAIDIYITPYLNEAQITSGTLSYAIGSGVAVLSTPYWHAQELLAEGRGVLFDFKSSEQLGEILIDLLDHPEKLKELQRKAAEYGKHLGWKLIGKQYLDLGHELVRIKDEKKEELKKPIIDVTLMPKFDMAHIKRLTDDTGIVQHAKYGIPNLKEGYCLDDNGRALLLALMAYRQNKDKLSLELLPIYLSYIKYMQNIKGTFRNFLSFNRQFLDEEGSEDSFGRTIWALGHLIRYAPNDSYYQFAKEIFDRAYPNFKNLAHIRGKANTMIGICHYLKRFQTDEGMLDLLLRMTTDMIDIFVTKKDKSWKWFENILTYDNAILPLSLFHSAEITGDARTLEIAEEVVLFLEKITMKKGFLSVVGSNGWYRKNSNKAVFDQQSIDVMAMVLMYYQAYIATRKVDYIDKMFTCYLWFHGENELRIPIYDHETAGCNDGLEADGVNRNQGAESTLAYLISHLTILMALEIEYEYEGE